MDALLPDRGGEHAAVRVAGHVEALQLYVLLEEVAGLADVADVLVDGNDRFQQR